MSYEKIKTIKLDEKEKKVFINGASNNIIPLNYRVWECEGLSKIFKEQGKEVEIEILQEYDKGNFQGGNNKYTKALKVLRYLFKDEYFKFDWRNNWEESKKSLSTEEGKKEYTELLRKALNTKPKEKFILIKDYHGQKAYLKKVTSKHAFWTYKENEGKIFNFKGELENIKSWFKDGEDWKIKEVLK